ARHQALALAEVLVVRPTAGAAATLPPGAGVVLAAAAQVLASAPLLIHRAHLVQRLLHGLQGLVRLPTLERVQPLGGVVAPVAALASETLHLLEQLAELLWGDLVRPQPVLESLGLAEHHLVLALGEVGLQVGEPIDLLEQLQPLVTLLQ